MDLLTLVLEHPDDAAPYLSLADGYDASPFNAGDGLYWLAQRRFDLYHAVVQDARGVTWWTTNFTKLKQYLSGTP